MAPAETPQAFLRIAYRDLAAALAMEDADIFAEACWGFHLQQAIEKALKAWLLTCNTEQPPFTHNLVLLFQLLADHGAVIDPFQELSRFSLYAVQLRYDEEPDDLGLDRDLWATKASSLLRHVESLVA